MLLRLWPIRGLDVVTSANERMGSWVMAVTVLVTVFVTRHSEGTDHSMMSSSGHDHLDPDPDIEGSSEPSEVNTEQPDVLTSTGSSILIVYEGEDLEGEYAREVLRYELNSEEEEIVREITENLQLMEIMELRDRNSSAELDPGVVFASVIWRRRPSIMYCEIFVL